MTTRIKPRTAEETSRCLGREITGVDNNSPFLVVSSSIGWNRIVALKRIRARLIEEYHPLIDLVIKDYEVLLRLGEED